MKPTISIFFHNYYGQHDHWVKIFKNIPAGFNLYYNVVKESVYNHAISPGEIDTLFEVGNLQNLHRLRVFFSTNKGKDIGGKMVMMDAYLHHHEQTEYIIFLHDKKSPYSTRGDAWREKLFRIIEPSVMQSIIEMFKRNKNVGILAAKELITHEYDTAKKKLKSVNEATIRDLLGQYKINETEFMYVAGTMFFMRSAPLQKFFSAHHPFAIRAMLENGNIMDDEQPSYTHSWERILPWLVTSQGFSIKGI